MTNNIQQALITSAQSIVLVGIMGCGKTHLGRMLASHLDLPFLDSDREIESDQGKSIAEIFEHDGEESFRKLETKKIKEIIGQGACVLSSGGGAFANESSRKVILDNAISIWLDCDLDILFERVSRNNKRPLLLTNNPKQTLADLLQARKPYYEQADIHIKSEGKDIEILEEIKKSLYAHLNLD